MAGPFTPGVVTAFVDVGAAMVNPLSEWSTYRKQLSDLPGYSMPLRAHPIKVFIGRYFGQLRPDHLIEFTKQYQIAQEADFKRDLKRVLINPYISQEIKDWYAGERMQKLEAMLKELVPRSLEHLSGALSQPEEGEQEEMLRRPWTIEGRRKDEEYESPFTQDRELPYRKEEE